MTAIRGLRQEIGRLKNTMESPNYGEEPIIHSSEDTRIHCYLALRILKRNRMSKFDVLKKYIPMIQADSIGEWVFDKENDGNARASDTDAFCRLFRDGALLDFFLRVATY